MHPDVRWSNFFPTVKQRPPFLFDWFKQLLPMDLRTNVLPSASGISEERRSQEHCPVCDCTIDGLSAMEKMLSMIVMREKRPKYPTSKQGGEI